MSIRLILAAALAGFAAPLAAQDTTATITTATTDQYGTYLTDAGGRAVYNFTADTQGTGSEQASSTCTGECAAAWPPVTSTSEPAAGGKAEEDLLGRIERPDGSMQVTYNGWPLYYYAEDTGPEVATGQDIESHGGEWYLLQPSGEIVGHE